VGYNSSTQASAPRSIAQYLETYIAGLESDTRAPATTPSNVPQHVRLGNPSTSGWDSSVTSVFAPSFANAVVNSITPSFLGLSRVLPIARCVVAGTQLPSARRSFGGTDLDENHPRSIINPASDAITLDSIPLSVSEFLLQCYLTRVITQYPIYHVSDVINAFQSIYYPTLNHGQVSPRCVYITSLIMAIALSSAARNKQARANAIAAKLLRNALSHLQAVASNDMSGLQALLLLAQYTFLNPSAANLWLLTGFTSQACIDLGLHQELPVSSRVSDYERDLRRRVFWCAWEMEVATCAGLLRPLSIPRAYVNTEFPSEIDDASISEAGIDGSGRITKFTPRRIWLFRQIEADIVAVLYQNEGIPGNYPTLESWMEATDAALINWNHEVHQAAAVNEDPDMEVRWKEMQLYADIGYAYLLVTLYRPSPRIREPNKTNLMKAFVAAVQVADGYWKQSNTDFGNVKYVFHPCHHSFSAAITFLQALQRCKSEISEKYTFEQVEEYAACFTRFFSTISERWPAATRCLDEFERLLEPVKKDYVEFLVQQANQSQEATPIDGIGGAMFGQPVNLEDVLGFWNIFEATRDEASDAWGFATLVPHDWNAEFNFGMDSAPGV
jgi:hypothetical protein